MSWIKDLNAVFEAPSPNEMDDAAIARLTLSTSLSSLRKGRRKSVNERAALSAAKTGGSFPTACVEALADLRREQALSKRAAKASVPARPSTCRKLSDDQIRDLRARLDRGESQKEIALLFGISRSMVSGINLGLLYNNSPAK